MNVIKNIPKKGRCVFAFKNYLVDELIEESHVIIIPADQIQFVEQTILEKYYFAWFNSVALVSGNAMLYSHSKNPNMKLILCEENRLVKFFAKKNIIKGEELTFDYGYNIDVELIADQVIFDI